MSSSPSPGPLASPSVRNGLTLCGLWFLYGFVGIPLNWVFSRLVLENRIFNDFPGHIALRVLGNLMLAVVAAALGALLPRVVASASLRPWALGFAAYIGCLHLTGIHPGQGFTPADMAVEVGVAVLLGASAFLGYALAAGRRSRPAASSSGVSGA